MSERSSRPDDNWFSTGETTEHIGDDGIESTARDEGGQLFMGPERTEVRTPSGDAIGTVYERETLVLGTDYTEYVTDDGVRYTARMATRMFSNAPTVIVRDAKGDKVGEAWMTTTVFGKPRIETEGHVPQGLASEMLGAREQRRGDKRERKARKISVPDDEFGFAWAVFKLAFMAVALMTVVVVGLFLLAIALVVVAVGALVQFGYAEAVRRRIGPAVRLYVSKTSQVVWVGPAVAVAALLPLIALTLSSGDVANVLFIFAGLAIGVYLTHRASVWISANRLRSLDPAALAQAPLVEPAPAVLWGAAGTLAAAYLAGAVWLVMAQDPEPDASPYADYSDAAYADPDYDEYYVPEQPPDPQVVPRLGDGVFADTPTSTGRTVYADAPGDGFLAVRSAPSVADGARLTAIPHRAPAAVLDRPPVPDVVDGQSGRWLPVRVQGQDGWVFDAYVRDVRPPDRETVPVQAWTTVNEAEDGHLNLRAWSSVTSRIEGELPHRSQVYVEACLSQVETYSRGKPGRWCRVSQDGRTGWAFDAYLDGVGPR